MIPQEPLADLEVIKNNTKRWTVVISYENETAFPLYGYVLFFTVKVKLSDLDSSAVISKNIVCPDDSESLAGRVSVSLSSIDTNLTPANYSYDMVLQKTESEVIVFRRTVATGSFRVNTPVTRRTS